MVLQETCQGGRGTYEPGHLEVGHGGAREQGSGPGGRDGGELRALLRRGRRGLHRHLSAGRWGPRRGLWRRRLLGQLQLLLLHLEQMFLGPRQSSAGQYQPRSMPRGLSQALFYRPLNTAPPAASVLGAQRPSGPRHPFSSVLLLKISMSLTKTRNGDSDRLINS